MRKKGIKNSVLDKKIPTVLGLVILIAALISGLIFFQGGTGVFSPRATPQQTPKNIRVTNLTQSTFTVSFYTDEETTSYVKYGISQNKLDSQASDDRDQLSGSVESRRLHHITVRGLDPDTTYYFVIGVGSNSEFDQDGEEFEATTFPQITSSSSGAKTVYGSVSTAEGTPAEGSIVYLTSRNMVTMSSLVKSSGSWAIPLAKARIKGGEEYANLSPADQIEITVQGPNPEDRISYTTKLENGQPVPELVFGQDNQQASPTLTPSPAPSPVNSNPSDALDDEQDGGSPQSTESGNLSELIGEEQEKTKQSTASSTLDLGGEDDSESDSEPAVTTNKPVIRGKAKPNIEVEIEIHSDNNIQTSVTADENGDFELDMEALEAQLDPGEHTITYSYTDPDTGQRVTRTRTFLVEDPDAVQIAQADTQDDSPYSSGDPYPMDGDPTPTPDEDEANTTPTPTPTEDDEQKGGDITPTTTPTPEPTDSAATDSAETDDSTRSAVATGGAMPDSGSVETTIMLIMGGLFLIACGGWSWWLAKELEE